MGWAKTAARKAARATAARLVDGGDGGIGTDRAHGRVSCLVCGRPVRSRLGNVCSRQWCQQQAARIER